jgi:hypothetical protein
MNSRAPRTKTIPHASAAAATLTDNLRPTVDRRLELLG